MNPNPITRINGIDIVTVEKDGETYLPVKPICNAIGIDFAAQYSKLKEHRILSPTIVNITTVGEDSKEREMVCIPLKYVYGWLFTINPGKVAPEARETVERYSRECYEVLYNHFHQTLARQLEANAAEIELLKEINDAITQERVQRERRKRGEQALEKLRASRLDPQPSLF